MITPVSARMMTMITAPAIFEIEGAGLPPYCISDMAFSSKSLSGF
jgi:hypothetical protein